MIQKTWPFAKLLDLDLSGMWSVADSGLIRSRSNQGDIGSQIFWSICENYRSMKSSAHSVADPCPSSGWSRISQTGGGGPTPNFGAKTYYIYLATFLPKMAWKWKKFDPWGLHVSSDPWICHCLSCWQILDSLCSRTFLSRSIAKMRK